MLTCCHITFRAWYRMEWKTIFPYSMLAIFFHSHTKNFPFHIPFLTKIFFQIPFHTSIPKQKASLDRKPRVICIGLLQR